MSGVCARITRYINRECSCIYLMSGETSGRAVLLLGETLNGDSMDNNNRRFVGANRYADLAPHIDGKAAIVGLLYLLVASYGLYIYYPVINSYW